MKLTTNSNKKIVEYDVLRVIVTILVLLSHCLYYRMITQYGGIDYSRYVMEKPIVFRLLEKLKEIIYAFHMPLYMALSGALFFQSFMKKKALTLKSLAFSKAKRLLIPFTIVTFFYSVPLKYIAGYWKTSENIYWDILIGQFFAQGNTYLWFLPALFIIFIIVYLLEKKNMNRIIVMMVLLIVSLISDKCSILVLQDSMLYAFWFYLGYCFEVKREIINERDIKKDSIIIAISFFGLFLLTKKVPDFLLLYGEYITKILGVLLSMLGCYFTYTICFILSKSKIIESKLYKLLLKNSFGLYLYSDSWNYVCLAVAVSFFGSNVFNTNFGVLLLFITRFCYTTIIAILLTEMLRKFHIKYLY